MRKMLVVAYHLLKSGERYDPAKVWRGAIAPSGSERRRGGEARSMEPPEGVDPAPRPVYA